MAMGMGEWLFACNQGGGHPAQGPQQPLTINQAKKSPWQPQVPLPPGRAPLSHLDILHDHVDVMRGLDHLVQANDVGVHEEAQDLDLSPNCRSGQAGGVHAGLPGPLRESGMQQSCPSHHPPRGRCAGT